MTNRTTPYDVGVIHGRFQVLHHDHLAYLLAGRALCRHLVVGITNPSPSATRDDGADPARSLPSANPLTFYERLCCVRAALVEASVPLADFTVVPFPINLPDEYRHFVPLDATFFLTVYDDWGRRKAEHFAALGLRVHLLREVPPEHKGLSATTVRNLLAAGEPWRHLVPPSVADLLERFDLAARLRRDRGHVPS